jgi:hypothetical protein
MEVSREPTRRRRSNPQIAIVDYREFHSAARKPTPHGQGDPSHSPSEYEDPHERGRRRAGETGITASTWDVF